jgi:sulfoxide reductase heme-binding subunit YedZ
VIIAAGHGPSALWYATRGAGAVTTILLTASVVLGIGEVRRWQPVGAPRFAVAALHRTLSLLALVVLVVHIVTTLIDPFPHIGVLTAVIPFVSTDYRPLWVGFGTLAADLIFALVLTSLIRRRLGYRAWRGLHWLAYACWPVAILHGLGTGSDTQATWMLVLTLSCVAAVVAAIANRLAARETLPAVRTGVAAATIAACIALGVWLTQGPLARGWARRAGTPGYVLDAFRPKVASTPVAATRATSAPARSAHVDALAKPFAATLNGTLHQGLSQDGTSVVDLSMRLHDGPSGVLRIRLGGSATQDGGLLMHESAVSLGPAADPGRYQGRIEFLQGTQLRAVVGSSDGHVDRLNVNLSLGQTTVAGRIRATPVGAGA